jgi:hypothetical protein
VLAVLAGGCRSEFEGGGELRARRVVLEREVAGLREMVTKLEQGGSLIPPGDVAVAIEETLVGDILSAQLPLEIEAERFHATLTGAQVAFRGSPLVRLDGTGFLKEHAAIVVAVNAVGALRDVELDPGSGILRARISVEHLAIERASGLESLLSSAALDELARSVRLQIAEQLPRVQIPVRVEQSIALPALDDGPVRIGAARLPLAVTVSRVVAGQGLLWIGVRVRPGEVERGDASAPERQR